MFCQSPEIHLLPLYNQKVEWNFLMMLYKIRMKIGVSNLVREHLKECLVASVAEGSLHLNGGYAQSSSIIILENNCI